MYKQDEIKRLNDRRKAADRQREGMAPHWFKCMIMQLLAFLQSPLAAYVAVRSKEGEEMGSVAPQHIHILPFLIPDPHISPSCQLSLPHYTNHHSNHSTGYHECSLFTPSQTFRRFYSNLTPYDAHSHEKCESKQNLFTLENEGSEY